MQRVTLTMTAASAAVVMLAGCNGSEPVGQATPATGRTPAPATEQAAQGPGDASTSTQQDQAEDRAEATGSTASTSAGEGGSSGDGEGVGGDGATSGGEGGPSSGGDDDGSSGGDGGVSGGGSEPTPPPVADPPSGSEEGTGGSSGSAAMPAPLVTIRHGGDYWAVLWVDGSTSTPLDDIRQAIDDRWGPVWMDGDIACNRGAADALGAGAHERAVSVHFDTEAQARRFATSASLGAAPTGHAQVTTYCLD